MDYDHILLEVSGGVATLTINRPQVMNALSGQTLEEMLHALATVRASGDVRVLLLTGVGRAFCTGADLSVLDDSGDGPPDRGAGLESGFNPVLEALAELPFPFITAVNGAAAGGGCGYALAGDIVIAARSAYFLQPFANIGLVPDVGATWLLPRLAGRARALGMMMLAERIPAQTAQEWGLIWQVVDDDALLDTARALARRLADGPTQSYALMRKAVARAATMTLSEALAAERADQRLAGRTADHAEGVAAFREKRPPRFTGT